jgi:hypothetical protein
MRRWRNIARFLGPWRAHMDSVMAYCRAQPAMIDAEPIPLVLVGTVGREHVAGEELNVCPPPP